MISVDHVSKFYKGDIIALKDVTFEIESGEFLFLVGPSGAGKSTLVRLLIREELPSEGTIVFDDTDITKINKRFLPFYRQQIGVVFQDYKLIDIKTIRENIEFALEITGKSDDEIDDTSESLLELVGLQERQELFPPQLSGGEKQRAGIARALANEPKLLIADEPTGNLDPATAKEIIDILETVNSWGTTVLIATHDKDIVDAMKKRVVRLEGGELSADHVGGYDKKNQEPIPEEDSTKKSRGTKKESSETESPISIAPNTPLEKLNLPGRTILHLKKNKLDSVDDLLDMSEDDIIALKGIGEKKAREIVEALQSFLTGESDAKESE
jgi:cell division transport system ATP-binding protein